MYNITICNLNIYLFAILEWEVYFDIYKNYFFIA